MAATPETLALAALVILYFLLTAAVFFLRVRRARRSQQRRRQQQQVLPPPPTDPGAPLETTASPDPEGEEEPAYEGGKEKQPQRRRRRARRKRQQQEGEGGGDAAAPSAKTAAGKGEPLLPRRPQFPVASVAGALQRRLNERYDDLARASEAQCPTIEQVNEFINCLIDARNELQQRYKNVQRSFKIKKAMLSNHQNYRSSYESLFEQVCKLEIERDNLKKDAAIYNSLQERLLASVPYKLIMEFSAMEVEDPEITFDELLAKEKEDTDFWQPDGKMRSISSKVGK
ncbi:hypothetical protein QOZ80_1BG0062020 [Eleusine coracana subsp. coracana]|nr:hypothetical protein QOZ80_1BG0062020 [Eleusine coracana subsp. coracana]